MSIWIHTCLDAVWKTFVLLLPVFLMILFTTVLSAGLYKRLFNVALLHSGMVIAAFGFFGATIGCFVGSSRSPIVSSILPPLVTLLSGWVALLSSRELPTRMKLLFPGAMVVMMFSLLGSAFYLKIATKAPTYDYVETVSEQQGVSTLDNAQSEKLKCPISYEVPSEEPDAIYNGADPTGETQLGVPAGHPKR